MFLSDKTFTVIGRALLTPDTRKYRDRWFLPPCLWKFYYSNINKQNFLKTSEQPQLRIKQSAVLIMR